MYSNGPFGIRLSKRAIYFYFKNKEALLADLFDQALFLLRSVLGNKFEEAKTPVQGMEMAGEAFFEEFCTGHSQKALILFREALGHGKKMEERRKKLSQTISGDLSLAIDRLGQEAGYSFRTQDSPLVFAHCILGVYEKVAFHYLTDSQTQDQRMAMAKDAVEFTTGGIDRITAKG